jgi:beta-lactamase superfamily II metal-dependent hydrolase
MPNFDVMYVDMGQGDCTIIKCPDGSVVMIDCGSVGGLDLVIDSFNKAQETLFAWLGVKSLSAVILTHPDQDHYNRLGKMLYNEATESYIDVENIYFSLALRNESPLGRYTEGAVNNLVYGRHLGEPELVEVTLNRDTRQIKTWNATADRTSYRVATTTPLGDVKSYEILHGGAGDNAWNVSILAGNVPSLQVGEDQQKNAASLVVLFKNKDEKILITGDATRETQDHLYSIFRDTNTITNLTQFQVPHHGSDGCASRESFRRLVNPNRIIVSVGHMNNTHKHPRFSVINDWLKGSRLQDLGPNLRITCDYWKTFSEGRIFRLPDDVDKIVQDWRDDGETVIDNGRIGRRASLFWLENLDNLPANGRYAVTTTGDTLIRQELRVKLFETGVNGTITNALDTF